MARGPLAATLKRLDKAEAVLFGERGDGKPRGGVLKVPEIEYDLNAWERRAMAQQQQLAQAAREDQTALKGDEAFVDLSTLREPDPQVYGYSLQTGLLHTVQHVTPAAPKRPPLPPVNVR